MKISQQQKIFANKKMDSVKIIFINLVEAKKYIEKTKHKQYLCYLLCFKTKTQNKYSLVFNEINKQSMFQICAKNTAKVLRGR